MTISPLPEGFIPSDLRMYDPDAEAFPSFGVNRFLGGVGQDGCPCSPHRMPEKSSADIVDYTIDLSTWLENTNDTIATVTPIIQTLLGVSYDLAAIMGGIVDNYLATIIFASGPPNYSVAVSYKIVTARGLVRVVPFIVPINNVTSATDPPTPDVLSDAVTMNGSQITLNSSVVTLSAKTP